MGFVDVSLGSCLNNLPSRFHVFFFWAVGIDIDFCRAITAAIFDGQVDDKVDFIDLETFDRLARFENGDVDILASGESVDLETDVLESTSGVGKTFSQPTFYDGLTFAGRAP